MSDGDRPGEAPCFGHLLVGGHPVDPGTARDVARFRRAERQRLYQARKAIRPAERSALTRAIVEDLDKLVGRLAGRRIAVYWPIRGEPDLRAWMAQAHEAGAALYLPAVVAQGAALEFREWHPGCAMVRGIWNIPVPAEGNAAVPDLVIAPVVGVDDGCYRLGNGGGYYDRTLAGLDPRPRVIGVGFPNCAIPTIYPMPWDIQMDAAVLGDGVARHRASHIE
jgi:5-formyltetrahydrofolate cyclo-ligase